jgi:hypothetical protein
MIFPDCHDSTPSSNVTVASHTPVVAVGGASVTRPVTVTSRAAGDGSPTVAGADDVGAAGSDPREQALAAHAAPMIIGMHADSFARRTERQRRERRTPCTFIAVRAIVDIH